MSKDPKNPFDFPSLKLHSLEEQPVPSGRYEFSDFGGADIILYDKQAKRIGAGQKIILTTDNDQVLTSFCLDVDASSSIKDYEDTMAFIRIQYVDDDSHLLLMCIDFASIPRCVKLFLTFFTFSWDKEETQ